MIKVATATFFGALILLPSVALAADKTVTLTVQNMYCAACPHTVRASLEAVPGVSRVAVSYKDKTAVVTYDDMKADVPMLTAATTKAGYPSAPGS
jgi:mercuric ion binding protein